jgi:hypothetical protein
MPLPTTIVRIGKIRSLRGGSSSDEIGLARRQCFVGDDHFQPPNPRFLSASLQGRLNWRWHGRKTEVANMSHPHLLRPECCVRRIGGLDAYISSICTASADISDRE